MADRSALVCWLLIGFYFLTTPHIYRAESKSVITRHDFPSDFIFGAGTSAYQVEGAAALDGRKPSIWDTFTHAGNMPDKSTGDVAAEQYHHYKEDVALMSEMGLDAYRFSISWSRLIPDGRGVINPKGVEYYNNLINELILHGVEPHITLYHFDLPQSLEDAYGGWLNPHIVKDFKAYVEVCFREFGDRVKYWITFNEANVFPILGYDLGVWPPQRCSYPFGNCSAGNSSGTIHCWSTCFVIPCGDGRALQGEVPGPNPFLRQKKQKGSIGISIYAAWFVPMTNSSEDSAATQIILDFLYGWIIEPVMYGDYPSSMRKIVGSRLPSFTKQESEKLRGSFDFIGLIHYTTGYASDAPSYRDLTPRDFLEDMLATISVYRNGIPIGELAPTGIPIVPWGMQALLEYFKGHYANPPLIIYENGYGRSNNESLPLADALNDKPRAACLHDYLQSLLAAIRNGSNARAYFVWSLVDSFEFLYGYTIRYGLYYVDFKHRDLKRYPNLSVRWYTHFLKRYTDHLPVRSCCYDHDHSFRKEQPLLEAI